MNRTKSFRYAMLVAGLLSAGVLSQAHAAGTAAGSTISNTATLDYQVGSVAQTSINSNNNTPTTFVVDRKVNVVVAPSNTPVTVVPNAAQQVLTFTVTNTSNAVLDFMLTAANAANGAQVIALPAPQTDSDDVAAAPAITIYSDAALTTAITSLNDLAVDTATTVYVVANIKSSSVNNAYIGVSLDANAYETDGVTEATATAGANTAGVDTVLADGAGAIDAALNGSHSAYGAYHVVTASLTLNKSSTLMWDGINGATDPKAIPGAIVAYCLVVTNNGAVAASNVVLNDQIPANTAYYATQETLPVGAPAPGVTTGDGAVCGTTPHGTSQGVYNSTPPAKVTTTYTGNIAPASSVWTLFYVKVL